MKAGWTTVRLGDLVDFHSGGTPSKSVPRFWNGDVPWFSAKDLKRDRLTDSIDHIDRAVFDETSLRLLPAGTIAVVVRGMILAHTVPISILDVPAAINQDLKALLPKRPGEFDIAYLAGALRAQQAKILTDVSRAAHGTTKLESRVLENIEIPLPPLDEQRRISAVLDKVDAIRASRRLSIRMCDTIVDSLFEQMSEGQRLPIGEIVALQGGLTLGPKRAEYPGEMAYLRVANVMRGRLDLAEVKTVRVTEKEASRATLESGDVLVVEGHGNADEIGRAALWSGEISGDVSHQNHLFRLRPDASRVLPKYLVNLLNSPDGRRQIRTITTTTSGLNTISGSRLKSIHVRVPPLNAQRQFAAQVTQIDMIRATAEQHLSELDSLFSSLQSRAFAGELDTSKAPLPL
ncbi:restriction endonuclease subunit S [Promicromonospora aerolata]|uniref:Restriction endonuclease subunit S n=1 Tax=Promicromonospora aerolata TaxID=195749 RepID=A0ABW4V1J5_9MICO